MTDIEPDDAGDEDGIPADLIELHEVLAWNEAVAADQARARRGMGT